MVKVIRPDYYWNEHEETSCRDCCSIGTNLRTGAKWCAIVGREIPDPDNIPVWCTFYKEE